MNSREDNTKETKVFLAPLQGFTDFVYRKCYDKIFPGIDSFFIPYISLKNNGILNKYEREILPENNPQKRVIPQVLVRDENEIIYLSEILKAKGYKEINLNMGCPYPMVTNRGKGAGLLNQPDILKRILTSFFERSDLKLSVKLRTGLISAKEIKTIIPVLNQFPLSEVILHPRVAKQLYSGETDVDAYRFAETNLKHQLVYNGDIFSTDDFTRLKIQFPNITHVMLGRGVLMNPFLPSEIKNIAIPNSEKANKLKEFHLLILEEYSKFMDNQGNVLNKMKQFWTYFIFNFPDHKKYLKQIMKIRTLAVYQTVLKEFFSVYN